LTVPLFNFSNPITDAEGNATQAFRTWMTAVAKDLNAASPLAAAAVPNTTNVIAAGGLQTGGALGSDVGVTLYKIITTVAGLPTTTTAGGDWAFARNGRKPGEGAGLGTGCPVVWSNGNWYSSFSGAIVAA